MGRRAKNQPNLSKSNENKVDKSKLVGRAADAHLLRGGTTSDDRDYVYDKIDDYHDKLTKDTIKNTRFRGINIDDSEKYKLEVLRVRPSSDEDEDTSDDDNFKSTIRFDDDNYDAKMRTEDIQDSSDDDDHDDGDDELARSDWGQKTSVFYNNDSKPKTEKKRRGKAKVEERSDSEDDATAVELATAAAFQKQLIASTNEQDYFADLDFDVAPTTAETKSLIDKTIGSAGVPKLDLSTKAAKIEYARRCLPEVPTLLEEMNRRKEMINTVLAPLLNQWRVNACDVIVSHEGLQHLNHCETAYRLFCLNVKFYLYYIRQQPIERLQFVKEHPVRRRIAQYRKLCDKADVIMDQHADDIELLMNRLENGATKLELEALLEKPATENAKEKTRKLKNHSVHFEDDYMAADYDETAMEDYAEQHEADDEMTRRAIDMQISRNRGLVPHKKGLRHSRVKKRAAYKKLTSRRKSQVPDVRRELDRYSGEKRGIKPNLVKSIKLKA